jgi:MOSC domain-containing protein YiiM
MANARVLSVSTGREKADPRIRAALGRTAIDKRPLAARVRVTRLGLDGDEQADQENHGGYEQAVYAYAREDLDWWVEQLGRELRDGLFGENITTAGLDITGAAIGETWRLGTAVVQVTSPRIPCVTFASWLGEPRWVKRFARAGRPGAYLRVLSEGEVAPGDDIEILDRPAVTVTVSEAMRAFYGDTDLMRQLLAADGLNARWDEVGVQVLG